MAALRHLLARMRALSRGSDLDRDFAQELESHLDMMTDENIRRGMSRDQARRAASISLGSVASLQEQHRAARGLPGLASVLQDLRFSYRLIVKDRWFSAAILTALALGIGANTTGFTIVNAAFFRGLPFDRADRLYIMSWQNRSGRRTNFSHQELHDLRERSRTFHALAGYSETAVNVSDDRTLPEEAHATWITSNLFGVLRQQPLLGRDFVERDELPGADPVAVIGHGIWKTRFGLDPSVLGRALRVNGEAFTIVGVMPEGMKFPDAIDLWMPFKTTDANQDRSARTVRVFGRLEDDVDRVEAQTEVSGIAAQLITEHPEAARDLLSVRVETFTERFVGGAGRPMFITVMGAVSLVLLIACANVASLLLSRSTVRAREIATRIALGATRGRIVRQLLVESLMFGFIGGGAGLILAIAGVRAFDAAYGPSMPYWIAFTVDYVVFGYVVAICVLTATLFGFAPALHLVKSGTRETIKEAGRGTTSSPRVRRFSSLLIVSELALTIVLLVGAGSLIRAFVTLYRVELGIGITDLMAMRVRLPAAKYPTPQARRAFFDRLEARVNAIPGIEASAVTTGVPPLDGGERLLELEGTRSGANATPVFVGTATIGPRFFRVLGASVIRGRNFDEPDGAPGSETVLVNQHLAEQFFPGEDPIGKRLRFTRRELPPVESTDSWRTIVGVIPSIRQGSPSDEYVNAVVYIPYRQESPAVASLLVRSALPPPSVMNAVRREVQAIDSDQPVLAIQTVEQILAGDRWWQRTWGSTFGLLAAIAVVLSALGLYSVMACSVTQRTQEIGVRMALGAQRRQVSWLILRRGLAQLVVGLIAGFAGSFALRRVLPGGIVGVTPHDPIAVVSIALLLTIVSIAACLIPARRATRVDPVAALRAE
jgi:putative ABC transport system permease protein